MPLLIIVSGLPASGKSTIANQLARSANFVGLSKDAIKEQLFDALGIFDREWSKKIGRASVEIMFRFARRALAAGASIIIESTFRHEDCDTIHRLGREFGCKLIQIHCTCTGQELKRRFRQRAASGLRHPGHVDDRNIAEFESLLDGPDRTLLALHCPTIEVETTDPSRINFETLFDAIAAKHLTNP